MRHFEFFSEKVDSNLFHVLPAEFHKDSPREMLSNSLGATLYIPAVRDNLFKDLKKMRAKGASSVVVCLEDSVPDDRLPEAEDKLFELLERLNEPQGEELPLIFVRPRTPEHFERIALRCKGLLEPLTGFVFPKFDDLHGKATQFMEILDAVNAEAGLHLYFMPVIESPSIIHRDTRDVTLNGINKVVGVHKDKLLAVRIGATDMSSAYGMRRSQDFTIYDNHVVSSALADIVNVLGRAEDRNIITGAVWEHFTSSERMFKPSLRQTIFADDPALRAKLLVQGYDTFLKEIKLDKLNGITGKTVIHPSHISLVHSSLVVTHEEFSDSQDILEKESGGAGASVYRNKMNEAGPHGAWARRVVMRAQMFGVAKPDVTFVDFLEQHKL